MRVLLFLVLGAILKAASLKADWDDSDNDGKKKSHYDIDELW